MIKLNFAPVCIVCGAEQRYIFKYQSYDYYRCPQCSLVTTNPIPANQLIEEHYAHKFAMGNYQLLMDSSEEYKQVYESYVTILQKKMGRMEGNFQGLKILDIGCFTGDFLQILHSMGGDVYGLELQSQAVDIANRRLSGRVFQADIESNVIPQIEFDVISLLAVIEHVVDPVKLIKQSAKKLKSGGVLLLQTPNSGSFLARIMRELWPPYAPVEHIHLFSKKSLTLLLTSLGFVDITFTMHWKKLPVNYVYDMMQNYGPEFRKLISPLYALLPDSIKRLSLPFYVGEMIIIAYRR